MALRSIDDRTLECVLAIYDGGSIRAAADEVNVAASAISRRLSALEAELGARLFERFSTGLRPTPIAEALVRYARERRHLSDLLATEIDLLRGGEGGRVSVAVGEGYLAGVVAQVLTPFHAQHPGVQVSLETGSTAEVMQAVEESRVDVGLAYNAPSNKAIDVLAHAPAPLCAILPVGHELARWTRLSLHDLEPYPLTLLDGRHGVRRLFDMACSVDSVSATVRLECNSIAALRRYIAAGSGIGVLPKFAAEPELSDGAVKAVALMSDLLNEGKSSLMLRHGRRPTPPVRALIQHLDPAVRSFGFS
ncbi:LysR family transcriptional regulator [Rhodovibrio salinarum]|uniref:LysR family transcriptional regulator n=1 Tax=Rhodovibrio salinarum TaxID=1087 RepID=A0A934QI79_9PROT|nr:LysR family transcriptional regulator [Rhodovibrio salinarum]MBK1697369.1 LysR family transcriptional regulator [Rhodovibrio salinarum]